MEAKLEWAGWKLPNNVTSALVDGVGMSDPVIRYQIECALCMFTGGGLLPRVDFQKKSQQLSLNSSFQARPLS